MLTDIFATRYASVEMWTAVNEPEKRLIVQTFRILAEQVCPYWENGKESAKGKAFWTDIQSRISMELGLKSLSPLAYSYQTTWNGKPSTVTGSWTLDKVCENWMLKPFDSLTSPDRFVKERLSLVELGFRKRSDEIKAQANVSTAVASMFGEVYVAQQKVESLKNDAEFRPTVDELNTRFRQANCNLNYHNGFIQLSGDERVLLQVETPFWSIVADSKWKNVDQDMKEALDRRDTRARDPAFYATRALESAIKIISDEKGWTHGKENGAHNYIDNLMSKRAGGFIAIWEADTLKHLFSKVRNPLGHGPGNKPMPNLTQQQEDWVIEECMIWVKSLVRRI